MADLDAIRAFNNRMEPHRTSIGEERNVIKGVYKEMRKAGVHPKGYKMAKSLEAMKPTAITAILASFKDTLAALGIGNQAEMPFGVIQGGKEDEPRAGARAKVSDSLKPPSRGKVRGKGGLNRQPDTAA